MTTPSEFRNAAPIDAGPRKPARDPRLDFFRGVGMFIILIAHIPGNDWILWIPARFGFSDATEMFVFLSGMASAIAFGRVFDRDGFIPGSVRVAKRVWQIYWIHVAVFVVIAAMVAAAGTRPDGSQTYVEELGLSHFFADPGVLLGHFLTLTYVPNYFDILPMYLVILAMMPVVVAIERAGSFAALLLVAAVWGATQLHVLDLPAEPWSTRAWFFDPFGWQLLFFLGFFFMRGKLPVPSCDLRLIAAAVLFVLISVPFAYFRILEASPFFAAWAHSLAPFTDKTHFGILRLVHFLALGYLAMQFVGEGGRRLTGTLVGVISKVGQQTLAVFVSGMVGAQVLGIVLDHIGRNALTIASANLAGFAFLVLVAYGVAWFKSSQAKKAGAKQVVLA